MKERIEWLKGLTYIPQKEIAWLIEQAELAEKQRAIIEENKRQQEVTVNQFRQAQEEISRLRGELKQAHEKSSNHLDEWRRAETQTAKISDELMNMKGLLRVEQGKVRQAQEEIQRITKENSNFRRLLATFTDEEDDPFGVVRKALNGQFPAAWEGDAE
ncbi:hypothetical protein P9738_01090 [Bacillus siamensis]|uniref:hypothetical protein n=1 Tax=Bacillus siamensis TaxID=659243 RepID=UPI002EBBCC02|nr:hypothetical protein [Bacillus siamensis]MED5094953.1 hypothetical protein [Bacillus siamensis]